MTTTKSKKLKPSQRLEAYIERIEKEGEAFVVPPIIKAAARWRHYREIYKYRPSRLNKYADMISVLRLPGGGEGMFVCAEWQLFLLSFLVAFTDEDGSNPIRWAGVAVPRKCGKSSLAAAFLLCRLVLSRGNHYILAPSLDVAKVTMNLIIDILEADRREGGLFINDYGLEWTQLVVRCRSNGGTIRMMSAAARSNDAVLAATIYADEIAALPNSNPLNVMRSGQGHVKEKVLLWTSTPGDAPTNAFNDQREIMYDRWLTPEPGEESFAANRAGLFYEASIDADWRDHSLYPRVNPMFGHMPWLKKDYEDLARTAETSAEEECNFRTRQLACPIPTSSVWLRKEDIDVLDVAEGPPPRGADWHHFIGMDTADSRDTNSLCLLSINKKDGRHQVRFHTLYPSGSALVGKDLSDDAPVKIEPS